MRVLFDSQIFDWQISGGISRYFIEVINRLEVNAQIDVLFNVKHSYNTYIQDTPWLLNKPFFKDVSFKGKLRILKSVNQFINRPYTSRQLKKGVSDVFHPTYFDPYFLKYIGSTPLVLTVYDLTFEKFNNGSKQTAEVLGWKKMLINKANHIIAISENTKKDIVEFYKIDPSKVTTVYLAGGFEESILNATPENEMKPVNGKYILFVGSRSGYKNFLPFIKEITPLLKNSEYSLVIAGGGGFAAHELNVLKECNIEKKVKHYSHVSDHFLAQLYKNSSLFIFPSLYEGFGLPVLEAMQSGCPILLSDNSSLPEVGGDAAFYFDPFKEGDLLNVAQLILSNPGLVTAKALLGREQIKKFDWDITAKAHVQIYKQVIK